jgi:hypothetical protein
MDVKFEDETPWRFELGDFLSSRDITYTDVTEIQVLVKAAKTDADAAALMTKKFSLSEIAFINACAIQVTIASSDFGAGKMIIDGEYFVSIGFTAPDYTGVLLEMGLLDDTLTVSQDGIRS